MRSLIAACVVLGLMAPASAGILDGMSAEAIYADASYGVGGNTINSVTGSVDDWVNDPPDGNTSDDLKWDHNIADWNGGLTAAGEAGGSSWYSSEDPNGATPAPVIRTTASGLNSSLSYNVYLTYYDLTAGVNAAITGNSLNNYLANYNIDTGVPNAQGKTAKLALLGEVSGVTEVSIDVGGAGGSYYDGLLVDVIPPTFMELLGDGAIYADATVGPDGNTVNKATGSLVDYFADPPAWVGDDGLWDHNTATHGNGGLDADGVPGGSSLYSNDDPAGATPAPVLTTTATGLDPGGTYDVYLTYYSNGGVNAALSGETLETYWDNWDIDSGVVGDPGLGSVKLAWLGTVTGVSEVGIDVGSTGSSYYEGLAVVVIPEPSTLILAFSGLLGLLVYGWRRRK